jgi:choline dehydrogenase
LAPVDHTSPRILAKYGITTKVALPGVGENLVDQPNVFLAWLSNTSLTGLAPYATFPKIAELFGKDVSAAVKANLTAWAKDASAASGGAVSAAAIKKLYDIQHTLIFNASVPTTELLTTFSSGLLITAFWPLLPFSRGSVHIGSADPLRQPAIDPRFFSVGFDLDATVAAARLANMFWATAPAAGLVEGAAQPDAATIMPNASDADWASYLVGSCKYTHILVSGANAD